MKTKKIVYKLIAAFLIPVILIVLLGVLSYETAAKQITKQYVDSICSEINSVSSYYNLLCNSVEEDATQLVSSEELIDYYGKFVGKNDFQAVQSAGDAKVLLDSTRAVGDYIYSYAVIADKEGSMSSEKKEFSADAYEKFSQSEEVQGIGKGKGKLYNL